MATSPRQDADRLARVEEHRQKFGDESAAQLDRTLTELQLQQAATNSRFAGFPKWLVILIAVWVGALETADKLPALLLAYPRYEANLAETQAKLLAPELARAQLAAAESQAIVAKYDADAAPNKPALVAAQLVSAENAAKASIFQPPTAAAQLQQTTFNAQASVFAPKTAEVNLTKLGIDTKTATYQQTATAAQSIQAAQGTAMTQAAMTAMLPMISGLMKQYGIDLPLDKLAPALGIIDPEARTRDLQAAMPNQQHGAATPAAARPTAPASQQPAPPTAAPVPKPAAPAKPPAPVRVSCALPDGSTSTMTRDDCRARNGNVL